MLSYLASVFIALDRLFNAVSGGDPARTISARVGYHITVRPSWHSRFWKGLAWMIDTTFKPLNGERHCWQAFKSEEEFYVPKEVGSDVARGVLGIIVAFCCVLLCPIIRCLGHFDIPAIESPIYKQE